MRSQLAIHFPGPCELWRSVGREDSIAAELADRHYSRQTVGADGFMPPGYCVAFVHHGQRGRAVWGVVLNLDPVGRVRWRNTIFRNESETRSSVLIAAATFLTFQEWVARYDGLPDVPLTTEIDIAATAARRGRNNPPGYCYLKAGWTKLRDVPAGHGRSAKVELRAP